MGIDAGMRENGRQTRLQLSTGIYSIIQIVFLVFSESPFYTIIISNFMVLLMKLVRKGLTAVSYCTTGAYSTD